MDLISREDVKKQLDFNLKHMEKQYHTILRCIYRQMTDLPVVESRLKGSWIAESDYIRKNIKKCDIVLCNANDSPNASVICSVCGEWLVGSDEYNCKGRYCPYCGAEMESE